MYETIHKQVDNKRSYIWTGRQGTKCTYNRP